MRSPACARPPVLDGPFGRRVSPPTAPESEGARRVGRPAALLLILLVAALPLGCVAFPRGAYWPDYE
ncbi:unnamed protein product, partial [marine sediment metagenome]